MSFTLRARGNTVLHTDVNQYGQYFSATATQEVLRAGNSASTYADSLTQIDTTVGRIFRAGYGALGSQTWMLDVTKDSVTIKNGIIYCKGPITYDVEAYANASDLNADGTFKINVDASTAINLAATALRAAQISGEAVGPYGWGQNRTLRFNSPVYTISSPLNLTRMNGCIIESGCGNSLIYCGNSWTNAGAWDSGVSGSGTTVAATSAPMVDLTGCGGTKVRGLTVCGQPLLGPASTAPTVKPAAGFLVASMETYSGSAWENHADSNNNTFERCSAIGWFTLTGFAFINSIITVLQDCGGQAYNNASSTHSLYIGRTSLNSSGNPSTTGILDSPFWPHVSDTTGKRRMARTETSSSDFKLINCEWHDMARYNLGGAGQSSLASTVLFYKAGQIKWLGGPSSSSGVAVLQIDSAGFLIDIDSVEFYNDAISSSGSNPNAIIWNRACPLAAPLTGVTIHNCVMNMAVANATILGTENAAFKDLHYYGNLHPSSATTFFNSDSSYTGAATDETLATSDLDCEAGNITVGGSIAATVVLRNPGTITVSVGGTNKSIRESATGDQTRVGNIATNGNVSGGLSSFTQHKTADGTAGAPGFAFSSDDNNGAYRIGTDNWGLSAGGSKVVDIATTGVGITGAATASTYIGVNSSTLPTTGGVRLPLNVGVHTRSTGGTSVNLLTLDGSDVIQLGQTTSISAITASAANTITLAVSAGTRFSANGTGIGFFATSPVAKPTVSGSRGGNAALASLLTALSGLGLLTDSSSA